MILRCWTAGLTAGLLSTLVGWGPAVASAADQVELRPRLTEGQELYYRHSIKADNAATRGLLPLGRYETLSTSQEAGHRFKVLELRPDGGAVLEWTIVYLRIEADKPQWPKHDSRQGKASNPMVAQMFEQIVDRSARLTLTPDGQLVGIKGLEGPAYSYGRQIYDSLLSETSIKQMPWFLTSETNASPAVGDQWKKHFEQPLPARGGALITDTTIQLTGADEPTGQATLALTGDITLRRLAQGQAPDESPTGEQFGTGKSNGELIWNTKDGVPQRLELRGELVVEMTESNGAKSIYDQKSVTLFERISKGDLGQGQPASTQPTGQPATQPAATE